MALSKKSGLFSSRNQGVPRWPTYTWLAKLLMRDRVTSVRMPLCELGIWLCLTSTSDVFLYGCPLVDSM